MQIEFVQESPDSETASEQFESVANEEPKHNGINKNKTREQKFIELILDEFMYSVESESRLQILKNEIVSDDGAFVHHFSVAERLELAKMCDRMN